MNVSQKSLSDIVVHNKYARYIPELKRKETWDEIVSRTESMHIKKFPQLNEEIQDAFSYVYDKKVLPSMRSLQFSGKPTEVNPARQYNCAYAPVDSYFAFSEAMWLLLSGTGVGYSVQNRHVSKIPEINRGNKFKRYLIADSIEGWADSVKALVKHHLIGKEKPIFDFSDIREKGTRLVTSGGKAPGAEPLRVCLFELDKILSSKTQGEKLSSVECHDMLCHIADAVLAGGIRRAAMISGFDFDDMEMRKVKSNFPVIDFTIEDVNNDSSSVRVLVQEPHYGEKEYRLTLSSGSVKELEEKKTLAWWNFHPQRGRANNTAIILRHKAKKEEFLELWKTIEESGAGEPGFMFSNDPDMFMNPCAEIALKPNQFCNLSTINVSDVNTQEELNKRARAAAFIGTIQASYTDFHYLRPIWKKTTEKEALIGVSQTGIASGGVLNLDLKQSAEIVKTENERVATIIGINKAARTTTIKPEGSASTVVGSSSGIHAWHNDFYIRRIRIGKNEPLYTYLKNVNPEIVPDEFYRPDTQAVVELPQKAPQGSITRYESALDMLERVKTVNTNWVHTGHRNGNNKNNVSATVTVKDHEWKEVGEWMWANREHYTALSVLPFDTGTYVQTPFEDCTEEEYERRFASLKDIDLSKVIEEEDTTNLQGELACAADGCEVK